MSSSSGSNGAIFDLVLDLHHAVGFARLALGVFLECVGEHISTERHDTVLIDAECNEIEDAVVRSGTASPPMRCPTTRRTIRKRPSKPSEKCFTSSRRKYSPADFDQ